MKNVSIWLPAISVEAKTTSLFEAAKNIMLNMRGRKIDLQWSAFFTKHDGRISDFFFVFKKVIKSHKK